MSTKVAINGFGRIGRLVFRHLMDNKELDVVAVNDIAPLDNLLYLLKYDSVQKNPQERIQQKDKGFVFGGKEVGGCPKSAGKSKYNEPKMHQICFNLKE